MALAVECTAGGHCLRGEDGDVELVNRFLAHLGSRNFSAATVRAYAYDLLNFLRFISELGVGLAGVTAADVFAYLDWQGRPARRGARDDEPADRCGARPVRVHGADWAEGDQPGAVATAGVGNARRTARRLNGAIDAIQLVYADSEGRFPWQEEHTFPQGEQPILGAP